MTKIASASPSSSGPSSRTNHTRVAEVRADELEKCTDRLSETESHNSPSVISLEQDRTSWQQPCYYITCLNPRTPKHDAFETRCKLGFKWWQLSKPRARPLDIEGQPRRNTSSRSETKGRCWSISNHPLEEGKQRLSKTTSSIINGDTMHDTTSTSIVAVDMGMQRNAATAPTAADSTTATRTRWSRNHQALACSTEQSAARRWLARFDP